MNAQTLILAILNFGDASGYEIKKFSSEGRFSYFIDISYGSIYPTLSKLEAEGFVTCRSEIQDGKPDKKVYSITDRGRHEFVKSLAVPPQHDKFKSEFLLVAMCADLVSRDVIEKAADKRILELEKELEMIGEIGMDCEHAATKWVSDYGVHVKQAALNYMKDNKHALLALAGSKSGIAEAAE